MEDARRILQPVAGATGKKANAADLIRERMRSVRGVLHRFLNPITGHTRAFYLCFTLKSVFLSFYFEYQ
jgi:hypothetical protein